MTSKKRCAIVGSGNIGTDLMYKLMRSDVLEPTAMIGIDPDSDGLARARKAGIDTSHEGADWMLERAGDFDIVLEATTASVHRAYAPKYEAAGLKGPLRCRFHDPCPATGDQDVAPRGNRRTDRPCQCQLGFAGGAADHGDL